MLSYRDASCLIARLNRATEEQRVRPKMDEVRRAAFLTALAETGNQTLAAERARVSRSWVILRRRTDSSFRRESDTAIAAAKARLAAAAHSRPPSRWRDQHGHELVLRGGAHRLVQVQRARLTAITPRIEARFLAALAKTCNVRAACRTARVSITGIYDHRQRWPVFAERWDRAMEDGYDALSMAVVAAAGAMLGDTDIVPEPAMGVPTVTQAIEALRLHQRRMRGEPCRRGWRRRPLTLDEIRESIMRRVAVIARARLPDNR